MLVDLCELPNSAEASQSQACLEMIISHDNSSDSYSNNRESLFAQQLLRKGRLDALRMLQKINRNLADRGVGMYFTQTAHTEEEPSELPMSGPPTPSERPNPPSNAIRPSYRMTPCAGQTKPKDQVMTTFRPLLRLPDVLDPSIDHSASNYSKGNAWLLERHQNQVYHRSRPRLGTLESKGTLSTLETSGFKLPSISHRLSPSRDTSFDLDLDIDDSFNDILNSPFPIPAGDGEEGYQPPQDLPRSVSATAASNQTSFPPLPSLSQSLQPTPSATVDSTDTALQSWSSDVIDANLLYDLDWSQVRG